MPSELACATATVTQQRCGTTLDTHRHGIVIARHRLEPDGGGAQVRDHGRVAARGPNTLS
ncbi:MAG TPA: hypothetical protein VFR88_04520 [Microlunatus sp.]|nr:hypothetical protein [Microlunatus sp.]